MIENLLKIGLNEELIEEMITLNGYDLILDLASNYELVSKNINVLVKFNIKNINEILLNRPDIFLKKTEIILKDFLKHNINYIVHSINEDNNNIDLLFE